MSKTTKITNVRLAGATVRAPQHTRSHTTPNGKRIRFYIGVKSPSVQAYALEVMAGTKPAITVEQYLSDYSAPQASVDTVSAWAAKTGHTVLGYDQCSRHPHRLRRQAERVRRRQRWSLHRSLR